VKKKKKGGFKRSLPERLCGRESARKSRGAKRKSWREKRRGFKRQFVGQRKKEQGPKKWEKDGKISEKKETKEKENPPLQTGPGGTFGGGKGGKMPTEIDYIRKGGALIGGGPAMGRTKKKGMVREENKYLETKPPSSAKRP